MENKCKNPNLYMKSLSEHVLLNVTDKSITLRRNMNSEDVVDMKAVLLPIYNNLDLPDWNISMCKYSDRYYIKLKKSDISITDYKEAIEEILEVAACEL